MNIESKHKISHPSRHQSGMSLIELMISMVIGLFLLAGVVTNFLSTTKSDSKREAVSEMDANAVLAFEYLRRSIALAGYPSMENTPMEMPFYTDDEDIDNDISSANSCGNSSSRDTHTIEGDKRTRDSDASGSDFLMVISLADNPCLPGATRCDGPTRVADINPAALVYTDCAGGGAERDAHAVACSTDPDLGMEDSRDAKLYSAFWLLKDNSSEDRTLYCEGNRGGSQPIVKDVEAIQYLYGVRDAAGNTNYRNATQVESLDQWPMVTSVQVGLLMRSSNQYVLDQPSTKTRYNLLKQDIDIADSDKSRLFRVYTTTINLENRQ